MSCPLNLFYSYCHKDNEQRAALEKHLAMLVRNNIICQWHDGKITAGSDWENDIKKNLEEADIVIFLITTNWLASQACIDEWDLAKNLCKQQPNKLLIPVIATECAWLDFDDMRTKLVLPYDGKAVSKWDTPESAWLDVYEGIKTAANVQKKNFKLTHDFTAELKSVEFCSTSSKGIFLDDIFVFPNLRTYSNKTDGIELEIDNIDELVAHKYQFIIGESQSGKTKLSAWLCLELHKKGIPCLYFDLNKLSNSKDKYKELKDVFSEQLTGSFDLWMEQDEKHIIYDNLSKDNKCIDFIKYTEEHFNKFFIFSNKDIYRSYFIDDDRFLEYREISIKPFCHYKQEEIIKKWLKFKSASSDIEHGLIDSIENNINSIIINNKILPRYPFFILSILQTYESFMPENLKITAYGHCYQALIIARLIKSGMSQEDSALESAFTFCSSLAFEIYTKGSEQVINEFDFDIFYEQYSSEYIIKSSVFNRLFSEYGILEKKNGKIKFCISYSFYYFLGKYLTENYNENKEKISCMVESSYARHNSLILIFTIHHANDINIIDEILTHTICVIDNKKPAALSKEETSIFNDLLSTILPEHIESSENVNVEDERKKERKYRTQHENELDDNDDTAVEKLASKSDLLNQVFQCNKNIEILSQILKNKTGSLKKKKLAEIVETICDAGLRMASVMLEDHNEIEVAVRFVYEQYKDSDDYDKSKPESHHLNKIRNIVNFRVMIWVLGCVEKAVVAINKPELKDIICEIVKEKSTPAYDLIRYFYLLDTCKIFDENLKKELELMLKNYPSDRDIFLHRIVSLRTQYYERTHRIKENYRQSILSSLGIPYRKPSLKLKNNFPAPAKK